MDYLHENQIKSIISHVEKHGRPLELYLLKHIFGGNYEEKFLIELENFQNEDGGFGHGLEPDFLLPNSSTIASTIALDYLNHIDFDASKKIVRKVINYFQDTYNENICGWRAASIDLNLYPHAPWWHYEGSTCAVDKTWANPTFKVVSYLFKYRDFVDKLDLNFLMKNCIDYILNNESIEEEHDIYCILDFYNNISPIYQEVIREKVKALIKFKIDTEESAWRNYVPMPVNFIQSDKDLCYDEFERDVNKNLDFLIKSLSADYGWNINWKWGQYFEAYEEAKKNWKGVLAIKNLTLLKEFGRILECK